MALLAQRMAHQAQSQRQPAQRLRQGSQLLGRLRQRPGGQLPQQLQAGLFIQRLHRLRLSQGEALRQLR